MNHEPMSFREAAKISRRGPPHPEVYGYDRRADYDAAVARYARATAIVDAAADAHEAIDTMGFPNDAYSKLRRMERGEKIT